MTPSTKCLKEELRRVPSHWAISWRYVCVGCEREQCIHVWALVCIRACVCPYVCFYAFSVHVLCVHVNVCVYYSTCTCVRTCVLSHCVCTPFTPCVGEGAHMYMSFPTTTCSCRVP